jgi:hypothetical protein
MMVGVSDEGKIRFVAVSEAFARDTTHEALSTALDAGDDWFDVAMVGSTYSTRRLAVGCSPPRRREVSACS